MSELRRRSDGAQERRPAAFLWVAVLSLLMWGGAVGLLWLFVI
jgi:hypothetical protein